MYWNINNRGNSDFFYCDYVLTYYLLFVEMIDWHLIVSCHPVRKILVSINQSLIKFNFGYNFFNRAKSNHSDYDQTNGNKYVWNKIALSLKKTIPRKKSYIWRSTIWYRYRWHWKFRGFTKACVHRWGMWESHSSQWCLRTY